MSKINIPPIKEGFNLSQINAAFDTVEQHLNEKVLYRNNPEGEPNSMANDLDMNGKRVYNLPEPASDGEAATLKTVKDNGVGGQYGKTLRTPENVNELPNAAGRANRLLSFDASGQPQVLFPSSDSATQLRIDLQNRRVNPRDFGGAWDGVTDDTEVVRRALVFANNNRLPVSFEGIKTFAITADAQILVNTDVDFAGAVCRVLNGIVASPSFNTMLTAFNVSDPATPLSNISLDRAQCDLLPKARKPFGTLRDGFAGYYLVETDYKVVNRLRTALENYQQAIVIDAEGATALGLSADLTSSTTVNVKYRPNSDRFITLANFVTNPLDYTNQILFAVQRSQVNIINHKIIDVALPNRNDICALYRLSDVADVTIDRLHGPARRSPDIGGASLGDYVINPEGCVNLLMNNLRLTGNKSVIASNNVNGVRLLNSTVIRFDVHSSGHNLDAVNVTFLDRGVGIGWGGGNIRVNSCRLKTNLYPFISDREDYAGTWFGCTMEVVASEIDTYASRRQAFIELSSFKVDATSPGVGNTLGPTYMPDVITVRDCHRVNNVLSGNITTQGVRITVNTGAVVYAPRVVNIYSINGTLTGNSRFGNRIDFRAMYPHRSGNKSSVVIRDCEGSDTVPNESFQAEGLTLTTGASNGLTATQATKLDIIISGIDAVCIETGCTGGRIHITESSISRVALSSDDATREALYIGGGCSAITPFIRSGETQALIGYPLGTIPTVYTPTVIIGLHVTGDYAFPQASVMQGVTFRVGATTTLPSGATIANAFSGFKLAQFQ